MSGPLARATGEMPGVGGNATAIAVTSAPTSVALRYAAALSLQNTRGANITQAPTQAVSQRSIAICHDNVSNPSTISATPDAKSLATIVMSMAPNVGGDAINHAPSPAVRNGPHR